MIVYPADILGCPLGGANSNTPSNATYLLARSRGRNVHRLKDIEIKDTLTLSFSFDAPQFNGWQSFWSSLNNGLEPFEVEVLMGGLPTTDMTVQALGGWTSSMTVAERYVVTLQVQVLP